MVEFKPRLAEGEDAIDDDKDSSFVKDWFERLVGDDQSENHETTKDTKKKKRFRKLFKPVFRMLFPRTENAETSGGEAPRRSMFGSNILGISSEENFKIEQPATNALREIDEQTVNISHETHEDTAWEEQEEITDPEKTPEAQEFNNVEDQSVNTPEEVAQPVIEEDVPIEEIINTHSSRASE
ncbi:MAG: hypothetical protein AAB914_04405, partial [Patescibacteria group bacterium]